MAAHRPLNQLAPAILKDIARYGCLNTQQIYHRHFSHLTKRRCEQVLADLASRGLLFVCELSILRLRNGRKIPERSPRLYSCQEAAGEVIEDAFGLRPIRLFKKQPRPDLIWHRFHMSETMLLFDQSCTATSHQWPRWILESDMQSDLPKRTPPNQRSMLYHGFDDGERRISLRLDAAFWLDLPQQDGSSISLLGGFETDLASEGMRQLTRTKPRGYHFWLQEQTFRRYWNRLPDHVRIFWCVPTARRIATIEKALSSYAEILAISRFVTQADRDTKNMLTDEVWWHPIDKKLVAIRT